MQIYNCIVNKRNNQSTSFKSLYKISPTERGVITSLVSSHGEEFVRTNKLKRDIEDGLITPGDIDKNGVCRLNMPRKDVLIMSPAMGGNCAKYTWGVSNLSGKIIDGYEIRTDHPPSALMDECVDLMNLIKQKCLDKKNMV